MRTLLKAACVLGFDGQSHVFWRNGEVVFSGNTIEFVGRHFPGHVDRTLDYGQAVICPGLIDLDALGDIDSGVLGVDNGSKFENGRLWSEDYIRRGPQEAYTLEEEILGIRNSRLMKGTSNRLPKAVQ